MQGNQSLDILQEQVRALQAQVNSLQGQVLSTQGKVTAIVTTLSSGTAVQNLVNNSDFSFSESGYDTFAYANSDKDLARWYRALNSATTQIVENTNAALSTSGNNLHYEATYGATPPAASWWNKDEGTVVWRVDDAIETPLPKNYGVPGQTLYVRLSAKLRNWAGTESNPYEPFLSTNRIRVSIWENTSPGKIAQGSALSSPTATLSAAAAAGAYTRSYILVSVDQYGNRTSSPVVTRTIDVPASPAHTTKYVTVTWNSFKGTTQWYLYRSENGVDYYHIATLPAADTRFDDSRGQGTMATAPTASQKALAQGVSGPIMFTSDSSFLNVTMRLKVPYSYTFLTSGKQWLRIDLVDQDGVLQSLGTAEVELDRILLATSFGTWTPNSSDNSVTAGVEITSPPNPYEPPDIGGFIKPFELG